MCLSFRDFGTDFHISALSLFNARHNRGDSQRLLSQLVSTAVAIHRTRWITSFTFKIKENLPLRVKFIPCFVQSYAEKWGVRKQRNESYKTCIKSITLAFRNK